MRQVYLIGIGMGNPDLLTVRARKIIERSDCLIGAKRMLEAVQEICRPEAERTASFQNEEIARLIDRQPQGSFISVLLSGDVGFYSGAKKLCGALREMKEVSLELIPGISSLQYLCARLETAWDDVIVVSVHGREGKVASALRQAGKVFVLTGSNQTAGQVCAALCREGLGKARVWVGEHLSYPQEKLTGGTAEELAGRQFDPLAAMLITAVPTPSRPYPAIGLDDAEFLRGDEGKPIPMTKQEVRAVAVSRLRVQPAFCVYDVGAGTGSVTVEVSLLARGGRVFAVEKNPKAVEQLRRNLKHFSLTNVEVVEGTAPDALSDLPAPDAVFIGGSSGNIGEIVRLCLAKNPQVRIVATAITLETVAQLLEAARGLPEVSLEISQISAARARALGKEQQMHLMMGQNPVFVCCLTPQKEEG